MRQISLATVAALAAGCGGGAKTDKPVDTHDCKTQVADLSKFFYAMNHEQIMARPDDDVHLAMRPELPALEIEFEVPMVTLTASGLRFQDKHPSLSELGPLLVHMKLRMDDEISQHRYPSSLEGKIDSRHLLFLIDASATWGDVVHLTEMIAKVGYDLPTFVFGKPSPVATPPRSSIDDELDKIANADAGESGTAFANEISKVIATCPPLITMFGQVSSSEAGPAEHIIDRSGPAILACDCNLDVAAYRSLIWRTVGNPHPETGLALTLAADGTAIAMPAATRWADAQKQLQPGTTVHLVAK